MYILFIGHYSLPEFREATGSSPLQITDGSIMPGGEYGVNTSPPRITSVNQTEIDLKELFLWRRFDEYTIYIRLIDVTDLKV